MTVPDADLLERDRFFIGGYWVRPTGDGLIDVESPATEQRLGHIPAGGPADIDRAVGAARTAFPGWAATPPAERADLIARLGDAVMNRAMGIGELVAREVGMPLRTGTLIQAGLPTMVLGSYAALARELVPEEQIGGSLVMRQPRGVVAAITPWNYPLHQAVAKVAPALAAGCTVVLKPSEVAPLTAFLLADLVESVGLPAGVFNVVSGLGATVGEVLVGHPDVDLVSFTGSLTTGRRVAALAGERVTPVALELGGKSAAVILDDADLADSVTAAVNQCFLNAGQTCIAWSRVLVPGNRYQEAAEVAVAAAEAFVVGDPLDWSTTMGPLVSGAQRRKVLGHLEAATAAGATTATGGTTRPTGLDIGHYVAPTVLVGVDSNMAIAREEVFGPVVCLIPHDGDDDAVRIANDSRYGLHGGVFSADRTRGLAVARRLDTGMVDVCGGGFNPLAPWGGWKDSGVGRELGRYGLDEYLQTKSLQLP